MRYGIKAHLISGRNLRRMRGPEGEGGETGTTPTPSADNGGGNAGGQTGESKSGDNTSAEPDYSSFWRDPSAKESTTPPAGGSAGAGTQGGGSPPNPAATLAEDIGKLNFGAGVMTESAVKKLGEGDASEFHTNLNQMGQQAVASAIQLMVPILGQLRDQMRAEIEGKVTSTNTNRDDEAALLTAIPSAKDPKVRPIVDTIYKQALKLNPGDRDSALKMTKEMLKLTATHMSDDIGLPPPSSGDNFGLGNAPKVDWLEELAGRS